MECGARGALWGIGRTGCVAADRARRRVAPRACARPGAAAGTRQALHAPGALGQGAELYRGEPRAGAHARRPHDARRVDGTDRQAAGSGGALPPQRGARRLNRGRLAPASLEGSTMREYSPLPLSPLASAARVIEPAGPGHVSLDDPAFAVMTDLREIHAACTSPEESVDRAQARMIERGVRLLFVLDDDAAIVGVITTTDILGEKPMRVTAARGVTHAELIVADLMTPAARIDSLTFQ